MFNKEELAKKSDKELKEIYQNLKVDFDNKSSQNLRIRRMLHQKIDLKDAIVKRLENEIQEILNSHPEIDVVKSEFDVKKYDPSKLRDEIISMQKNFSVLLTHKLKSEEGILNLENYIRLQLPKEKQLQDDLEKMIKENEVISIEDPIQKEMDELKQLEKEYQGLQDEFTKISNKISEISNIIHNKED